MLQSFNIIQHSSVEAGDAGANFLGAKLIRFGQIWAEFGKK